MTCESCYIDQVYGFDRARRDAERMAAMCERGFVVVELVMCKAAERAAKLGKKAYTVWSSDVACGFGQPVRIVEEYGPDGRVFQSSDAP